MTAEKIGIEKRRFKRQKLNTEARYTVLSPLLKKGIIKNISEGGLCFLIDEPLSRGNIMQIEFSLPGEETGNIKAVLEVMWQKKQGDKFITGLRFMA